MIGECSMDESAKHGKIERMSPLDEAWLRMDMPGRPRVIVALLRFDGALDLPALRKFVRTRLLSRPRFRQLAVAGPDGAFWQEIDNVDLDTHVEWVKLPVRNRHAAMQRTVERLVNRPL